MRLGSGMGGGGGEGEGGGGGGRGLRRGILRMIRAGRRGGTLVDGGRGKSAKRVGEKE